MVRKTNNYNLLCISQLKLFLNTFRKLSEITPQKPQAENSNNKSSPQVSQANAEKLTKPAKVEDKPFNEFINQDLIPSIQIALEKLGIETKDINFKKDIKKELRNAARCGIRSLKEERGLRLEAPWPWIDDDDCDDDEG